jgi:Mg-chelatase subunit ChlI
MDAREEIKRWLVMLTQLAADSESEQINADIELLMGVTLQLTTELTNRNAALAKQCRPRKAAPPKASPQKGPKTQSEKDRSNDTQDGGKGDEGSSEELSHIQQGIKQALNADPSEQSQQQLRQIYGAQNKDVAFNKAAKAIAS